MMLQYFTPETTTANLITVGDGAYYNGEWIPDTPEASAEIEIIVPQPVSANDLGMLEDGEHVRDYLRTYSKTRVFPRQADRDADVIEYGSKRYKVVQVDDRSMLGPFYRIIMRWENDFVEDEGGGPV